MRKHYVLLVLLLWQPTFSQTTIKTETEVLKALKWRSIGPWRAGRSLAVAGHPDQPHTYFFGATGGGIWRTTNGGIDWLPLADSSFGSSSVGALAVAPSDPSVVYAGMGETEIRGNISFGDGMYKSLDGGNTWQAIGLEKTYAISHIAVHPQDAQTLWVSAMGKIYGPNPERGVFKSTDGGKNWRKVLFVNDSTGAVDVRLDPSNPRVLYASTWQAYRNAYTMSSGGKGSGLYKSTDGGESWNRLSENPGMPKGILGKIGVAPAPDGKTVYALIESKQTGLYKSTDAGKTWARINEDKNLTQRPWYYMHLYADPVDPNTVYVLNVSFFKSKDGGKTFQRINIGHSDTHDLWINPKDLQKIILASDGGAEVSINGGDNWTDIDIATGQFYHVSVDDAFPFNIYGAQQDNSAVGIPSRTRSWSITPKHWVAIPSGESGYVAAHPLKPRVVFGGNYMGSITRYDHTITESQQVMVYPENHIGGAAENMKVRFNWTFPIVFSHHDKNCMYVTSQFVHRSCDEGMSWEILSPDLTTNDPKKLKPSGGPLTLDNTGAETHCTIFTFSESPVQKGVWWTGSDDGWVQLTRDSGKTWQKLTIPGLPPEALISMIEASPHDAGTAYLAATRYKWDDTKPYLFRTKDFGKTWTKITNGIPADDYTRVIREDPNKKGLLYAGTEKGFYFSGNEGQSWTSINKVGFYAEDRLPITPIHDIALHKKEKSLVVATHGRSFWVLDDLSPLHQWSTTPTTATLLNPKHTYRMDGGRYFTQGMQAGENPRTGALLYYYLPDTVGKSELKMVFLTIEGDTVAAFSSQKNKKGEPIKVSQDFFEERVIQRPGILMAQKGMNVFEWDMRWPDVENVDGGTLLWGGSLAGPRANPGTYTAKLYRDSILLATTALEILKDPLISTSPEDYKEQLSFIKKCNDKLSETHKSINRLRKIKKQVNDFNASLSDTADAAQFKALAKPLLDSLESIEDALIQTKAKAFQDLLNYPVKLNNKLASLASMAASADRRPPAQCYTAYEDIVGRIDVQLAKLKQVENEMVPAFNQKAVSKRPAVIELGK